jgi:hypothetical protein
VGITVLNLAAGTVLGVYGHETVKKKWDDNCALQVEVKTKFMCKNGTRISS